MASARKPISPALVIALISIPIFVGALDLTVVSAVLPQVIYDLELPLQTQLDNAAWIVTGYLLVYSVAMSFMGRLSDIHGRRKVYLLALGVFALGSLMVAVADHHLVSPTLRIYYLLGGSGRPQTSSVALWLIVAARMIQAFGGGAMVPVGMALVGDLYPPEHRGRALGAVAAVDTAGWVVGHLYGGIIVRYFDWRIIFWLNLPICLLGFILIFFALRGLQQPPAKTRMDWPGALLISASLTLLNVGLGSGSEISLTGQRAGAPAYAIPAVGGAVVFLGLFIWRQARARHPLLELRLFKRRNVWAASLANFLVGAALFIAIANVPLYINSLVAETLEQGAWESGWMLCALTIPIALASSPGGWLAERRGYRLPAVLGLLAAIAGFVIMSGWKMDITYARMVPQLAFAGIGLGLTFAPIATAVVNAAPDEQRGIASAMVLTFRLVGMTVGVSGMTTYGLRRVDFLTSLIPAGSDYGYLVQRGMEILLQVINETFLIAAGVCVLALIPAILLRDAIGKRKEETSGAGANPPAGTRE